MLRIEVIDEDCAEDEAHIFEALVCEPHEAIAAIMLLYPTSTTIHMTIKGEE